MNSLYYIVQLFRPNNFQFTTQIESQPASLYFKDDNLHISGIIRPQYKNKALIDVKIIEQAEYLFYPSDMESIIDEKTNKLSNKATKNFTEGYTLYDSKSIDNDMHEIVHSATSLTEQSINNSLLKVHSNEGHIRIDGVESIISVENLIQAIRGK